MINFIREIPRFAIADYCVTCRRWYPKHCLRSCPCCGHQVRTRRREGGTRVKKHTSKEIIQMIEFRVAGGWQPLNESIYDNMVEYTRLHRITMETIVLKRSRIG